MKPPRARRLVPAATFALAACLLAGCGARGIGYPPPDYPAAGQTGTTPGAVTPTPYNLEKTNQTLVLHGDLVEQGPGYLVLGQQRVAVDDNTRFVTPQIVGMAAEVLARREADGSFTALSVRVTGPEGPTPEDH